VTTAYVGLGSNVGDRLAHLRRAVELLRGTVVVANVSSVYDTEPVGPSQDRFLNAVVEVTTDLGPRELLVELKRIEGVLGREPRERWGPREVDLDLLLYGDERVEEGDLVVPHPLMHERAFVLVPLAEIAPDVEIPGHASAGDLAARADRSGVHRTSERLG
jgi:2-amino-4-hydroxy-6-hydroxymethyldihydropteridine diphosphokinase